MTLVYTLVTEQRTLIPLSDLTQRRIALLLRLDPLKVYSSCLLRELFLDTVASGQLII